MRLSELPIRTVTMEPEPARGQQSRPVKSSPALLRARSAYYWRNREQLKAAALARYHAKKAAT